MRWLQVVFLLALCTPFTATAQVSPSSNGSCSVNAAGLEDCDWLSAYTLRRDKKTEKKTENRETKLFVTHYTLAPGAPLRKPVSDYDNVMVGMNGGELVNDTKSPPNQWNVTNGAVVLMPEEEDYLLRNIGKQNLELLVIEIRK